MAATDVQAQLGALLARHAAADDDGGWTHRCTHTGAKYTLVGAAEARQLVLPAHRPAVDAAAARAAAAAPAGALPRLAAGGARCRGAHATRRHFCGVSRVQRPLGRDAAAGGRRHGLTTSRSHGARRWDGVALTHTE
jgi:hypothetical protein